MSAEQGQARIHDRGYRPYDGPRGGVPAAMRSVGRQSVQRAFGIRRSIWAKLPPVLIVALAFVPALVYVGIAAVIPVDATDLIPAYSAYYSFTAVVLLLFVAWTAPETLSADRRTGMLGLYLASPLSRFTYLAAKSVAIGAVLLAITLGPVVFLVIARWMVGSGPAVEDLPLLVIRMLMSAVVLSGIYGLVGAAVAAFADRRPIATVATILLVLILAAATSIAVEVAEYPTWIYAADPTSIADDSLQVIWNTGDETDSGLPDVGVMAAALGWMVALAAVTWLRYHRLEVTG